MANYCVTLDRIFGALADPTRLAVVGRLSRGPLSAGDLAKPFKMALPSFLQHIRVLEEAGLVRTWKVGRVRMCDIEPGPLLDAEAWLTQARAVWAMRREVSEARARGD